MFPLALSSMSLHLLLDTGFSAQASCSSYRVSLRRQRALVCHCFFICGCELRSTSFSVEIGHSHKQKTLRVGRSIGEAFFTCDWTSHCLLRALVWFQRTVPWAQGSQAIHTWAPLDFHFSLSYLQVPISDFLINEAPIIKLHETNAKPLFTISEVQSKLAENRNTGQTSDLFLRKDIGKYSTSAPPRQFSYNITDAKTCGSPLCTIHFSVLCGTFICSP
jgi:hypothetical protein